MHSLKLASIRTAELPFFAHFSVVALKLPSTSVPVDAEERVAEGAT